uniref:Pyrin domain-containing protein n=1 Tax=Monopterus albus TaxID=43700 RepID=A0A3Q3PZI3_MONAL
MAVQELLLGVLEDLYAEDFKKFQWFLPSESDGRILKSHLENKSRIETVSKVLCICTEESEAVDITVKILKKIGNNNAAEKLKKAYAGDVNDKPFKLTFHSK